MVKFCDTTNFTLCFLLESIDLILVTLTRRTCYKAIESLGNYLDIANWMCMWSRGIPAIGKHV